MSEDAPKKGIRADSDPHDTHTDGIEEFASRFEQQWHAATGRQPEASALDSALWSRIRKQVKPRARRWPQSPRETSAAQFPEHRLSSGRHEMPNVPSAPSVVPSSQWLRGLLVFSIVALIGCIVFLLPGGSVDPRYGAHIREAPQIASPAPAQGCNVRPLTRDQMLAIVLDPERRGFSDTRALFATPPPKNLDYPHTRTWLPEADDMVDMAGGSRPVRRSTIKEFRRVEEALNRYLRCQVEGTNYQLWALESPMEVQRQILQQISANRDRLEMDQWSDEEITETMILDTIEQFGPQKRPGGHWYMLVAGQDGNLVEANPDMSAALVADDPETGKAEYAWIGTRWVDPATGEIVNVRGAGLDATPAPHDGYIDNLVVMILKHDPATDTWLVEWLVPTI